MRKNYLLLIFTILVGAVFAQENGCDNQRYINEIFTDVTSTTVKFGENYTFGGDFQELYMDIYEPMGDTRTDRPVIVFAFGGAYVQGDRTQVTSFCEEFARKGFVAAAIDYRIYAVDVARRGKPLWY